MKVLVRLPVELRQRLRAVIPREGVESMSAELKLIPSELREVIPREGVESYFIADIVPAPMINHVIPREGVESRHRVPCFRLGRHFHRHVIPREGVEINVSEHLLGP